MVQFFLLLDYQFDLFFPCEKEIDSSLISLRPFVFLALSVEKFKPLK